MIKFSNHKVRFSNGSFSEFSENNLERSAIRGSIARKILVAHNIGDDIDLKLRFDALVSHDITFVNIIQTAKACGLEKFPLPYILTNCHNSLCAVGGSINEDDHVFGLSAAVKYGGVFVPPHMAVIHSFMREKFAGCGKMILGSDSHTRYGALGTLAIGEGGGELTKQLLGQTYDVAAPDVIAVRLSGVPRNGVGPQDVALALIGAVFQNGFVKNKIMEFMGEGIANLPIDFRFGIDVMTTETACLSSVWLTDDVVKDFLTVHGRADDYQKLEMEDGAVYDGLLEVDLSQIKPMMALPFHPSNVFEIDEFNANAEDILREVEKNAIELGINLKLMDKLVGGRLKVDQAVVAGCAGGTFDNIMAVENVLSAENGTRFYDIPLSIYPGSQPILLELTRNGTISRLLRQGVVVRTAFCGPCFGAGDAPSNNGLSIRHTTRNFPNREGSRPSAGQSAGVVLMDARSIAATMRNKGFLASAEGFEISQASYSFDDAPYRTRVYNGWGRAESSALLRYGPNIVDWPEIPALGTSLLLKIVSYITDAVTTTDELIPSGETSSFRSNPVGLAEFTLSRKDPSYVGKAKAVRDAGLRAAYLMETPAIYEKSGRKDLQDTALPSIEVELKRILRTVEILNRGYNLKSPQIGSAIFARKPGDGSAREQAASCQKVLGGLANFANEYATKRYRSNLINWGILPFVIEGEPFFKNGDYLYIRETNLDAQYWSVFYLRPDSDEVMVYNLKTPQLTQTEKEIICAGCLINYNRQTQLV
ncbi:MAG: hydratase [Treponema sp.]|jgi:aconitate hydratase|nr:hydratase [Treponema sp.]